MVGLLKKRNLLISAMGIMMLVALVLVVMSFTNIQVAQAVDPYCYCKETHRTCTLLPNGDGLVRRYYTNWCCDCCGHCWWDAPCPSNSYIFPGGCP